MMRNSEWKGVFRRWGWAGIVGVAGWLGGMVSAQAAQTDTHGLHAVPAAQTVVIDADLAEWDLSGQTLLCFDTETLRDIYSGQVAMMYDRDFLYVSIHWKSPAPLINSHDPQFQANKGWAGDSVQLRIKTDRISHLTAWCYAKKMEPCIQIDYGKSLTEPFGGGSKVLFRTEGWRLQEGAEMAFRKDADGKGYVQEIKIPWTLITDKKIFAAGDRFSCGVELLWGGEDWPVHRYADNLAEGQTSREFFWTAREAWGPVILEAKGNLQLPAPAWKTAMAQERAEGPVEIAYELAKAGRVTLAIENAAGKRIRNLLAAAERPAGRNTDRWDGCDDEGKLVVPGAYRVKGLTHEGLRLSYAGAFASPGRPGWPTADNKGAFYGDHTAPQAAAAGKDIIALACPMGEAGKHLIGVKAAGQRQWGQANRMFAVTRRVALATDGTLLWIANAEKDRFTIWRCELATGNYSAWRKKDAAGKDLLDLTVLETAGEENCRTLAWRAGVLAVPLAKDRRVLLLDAQTGDTRKSIENLPAGVSGCAFLADDALVVAAPEGLHRIDLTSGGITRFSEQLDDPQGVAVSAAGEIYVAQRGAVQNVTVFSATGTAVRQIGKRGGRPEYGRFEQDGMRDPAQISLDSAGRLWVPEERKNPKRTSVWNADGTLALDLSGTTGYAAGGTLSPVDPARGISEGVEYQIDYAAQTARPLFALHAPIMVREGEHGAGGFGFRGRIVQSSGHEYYLTSDTGRSCGWVWVFVRTENGAWRAAATFGRVGAGTREEKYHADFNRQFMSPFWDGWFGKSFVWVDRNDDGDATRDEVELTERSFGGYYWGQMPGADLTVALPLSGGKEPSRAILSLTPQGFTPAGTPLYSFKNAQEVRSAVPLTGEGMLLSLGVKGGIVLNQEPLTGLAPDGGVAWTYPSRYVSVHGSHRAPGPRAGLLIGPSSFYGTAHVNDEIGDVFYLNGNLGQNFLFTADGLWVQSLYKDCRGWFAVPDQAVPGMNCDTMTAGGESFGGGFVKTTGGKYYTVGGGTAAVVMEITGLDTLRRFSSAVTVTAEQLAQAQQLLERRAAREMTAKTFLIRKTAAPLPLEGDLSAWAMDREALEIPTGQHAPKHRVKAFYDAQNLYLAYEVEDASALKNAGQDERLMCITGDCVDLMLRTDAAATDARPVRGDLRLLLTVKDGKPLAVLYEPVVPGAPQETAADLSSPWRTVHFDRLRTVAFPLTMQKSRNGSVVRAAVPLALLGVENPAGRSLRGDFGVLASDSAGQECTARNYWSNKATNNTNDVPDEVMLVPSLWGELRFE